MSPKKRKKHRGYHSHDVSNIEEEIEALFNKKFLLKSSHETWSLPPASCMFEDPPFVVEDMIEMKNELNRIKSMLNDVDIVQWHLHTRRANKSGLVVKHLREEIRVEMCTQAWAKFYEVLNSFDLIPEEALDARTFRSLHLCEAPGAFVASLNHFLKSNHRDLDWTWIGTTLNPYYEGHDLKAMLDDDRFILETLPHWNFGADGTGDLMNWANMQVLQQDTTETHLVEKNVDDLTDKCTALYECLYRRGETIDADGSIDCADQPAEQEHLVSQLIFCEAVAAICLLSKGGNFVFKMFTAFEHQMICLLYFLSCLFDEIQVVKPGTSKSGNSEVYVACLKFMGSDKIPVDVLEKLKGAYSTYFPARSLFPWHVIPGAFLERLKLCEKYFTGFQMKAIELHIQQFHHLGAAEKQVLFHLRQLMAQRFVEKFVLQPIRKEDRLVPGVYLDGTQLSFNRGPTNDVPFSESFSGRQQMGSYNERQQKLRQNWLDRFTADAMLQFVPNRWTSLQGISQAINEVPLIPLFSDDVTWLRRDLAITADEMQAWKAQTGRSVDCVFNSRFCTPRYISKLRDAQAHAQVMQKENSDMFNEILDKLNLPSVVDKMNGVHAELRNLDNLVHFADMAMGDGVAVLLNLSESLSNLPFYLQERNARFKCIYLDGVFPDSNRPVFTVDENHVFVAKSEDIVHSFKTTCNTDAHKVNLIFLDLHIKHARDGQEELQTKRDFLHLCIIALRLLETGGMLVCHIFETLTRFSMGIFYILHQLFKEVTVVKPVVSNLHNSRRYVVCKGRHDDGKHLITFLELVATQLTQLKSVPETCSDVLEIVPMRVLYSDKFFSFVKRVNEQLAHLQLQTIAQLETFFLFPEKVPSTTELDHLRDEVSKYLNLQGRQLLS